MHNMTAQIGKLIDRLFLGKGGACIDRSPRLQSAADAAIILFNKYRRRSIQTACAMGCWSARDTFIIKCWGTFSTILLLLRTLNWDKWPPKAIYYHNNAQEGSLSCDYKHPSQHHFNAAPPNVDTSRPEAYKAIWLSVFIWTGYVSCMVNCPPPPLPAVGTFKGTFWFLTTSVLFLYW